MDVQFVHFHPAGDYGYPPYQLLLCTEPGNSIIIIYYYSVCASDLLYISTTFYTQQLYTYTNAGFQ